MNKHSIQEIKDSLNRQNERVVESLLDRPLLLDTPQWRKVEQLLTYLTEFAPGYKITELTDAICCFADDQTKRADRVARRNRQTSRLIDQSVRVLFGR